MVKRKVVVDYSSNLPRKCTQTGKTDFKSTSDTLSTIPPEHYFSILFKCEMPLDDKIREVNFFLKKLTIRTDQY